MIPRSPGVLGLRGREQPGSGTPLTTHEPLRSRAQFRRVPAGLRGSESAGAPPNRGEGALGLLGRGARAWLTVMGALSTSLRRAM